MKNVFQLRIQSPGTVYRLCERAQELVLVHLQTPEGRVGMRKTTDFVRARDV